MNKQIINFALDIHKVASFGLEMSADLAQDLAELGYRKSTDVAREIFAEIERLMLDGAIGGKYPAKVINPDKFAELKKKYESEGAGDEFN